MLIAEKYRAKAGSPLPQVDSDSSLVVEVPHREDSSEIIGVIPEERLPHLHKVDIGEVGGFAGLGHNRVRQAISEAISLNGVRHRVDEITVKDMLASHAHGMGSNNKLAKWWTETIQQSVPLQRIIAGPYNEAILRHDAEVVVRAAQTFLDRCQNNEILLIAFHPDIAYNLCFFKTQLARRYNKNIRIAVYMTDHLLKPQYPWYQIDADFLIVPDHESGVQALSQLEYWEKTMQGKRPEGVSGIPKIIEVPYPIDPRLVQPLDRDSYQRRLERLRSDNGERLRMVMPLGGSAPQTKFMRSFAAGLVNTMDISTVAKATDSLVDFLSELRDLGVGVKAALESNEVLDLFIRTIETLLPEFFVTKPSEQTNLTLATPRQVGGGIVLLTEPVGDQEKQNLRWLQKRGLIPSDRDAELLDQHLLRLRMDKLEELRSKARHWRGLRLPSDSAQAVRFVLAARNFGIFEAMGNYQPATPSTETVWNGAQIFWQKMDEEYARLGI